MFGDDDNSTFIKPMVGPVYRNLDGSYQKSWIQQITDASLASAFDHVSAPSPAAPPPSSAAVSTPVQSPSYPSSGARPTVSDAERQTHLRHQLEIMRAEREAKERHRKACHDSLATLLFLMIERSLEERGYSIDVFADPREHRYNRELIDRMANEHWLRNALPSAIAGRPLETIVGDDPKFKAAADRLAADLIRSRDFPHAVPLIALPLARMRRRFRVLVKLGLMRKPSSSAIVRGAKSELALYRQLELAREQRRRPPAEKPRPRF